MNLIRGWLPHLGSLAWGLIATLLWQRAQASAAWVPITVRGLLRSAAVRAELGQIIAQIARYANLSAAERRDRALESVRAALAAHGLTVTNQELATLVELLYAQLKRTHPEAIAPAPKDSGQ